MSQAAPSNTTLDLTAAPTFQNLKLLYAFGPSVAPNYILV